MKKLCKRGLLLVASLAVCLSLHSPSFAAKLSAEELAKFNAVGIGTGSVGSTFYAVGGGFANVWKELGVRAAVEVTGGSIQNCLLVGSGQLKSALISQGAAYQAWKKEGLFKDHPAQEALRAALPLQSSLIHGWTLDPKILTYRDLGNKIVSGGPAGGTSEEYNKAILNGLGIKPKRYLNAGFADTTGQLGDGLLEAVFCSMGVPTGAAAEAASTLNAKIIGVHPDDFAAIQKILPFLVPSEVPAATYAGQTNPVPTLADLNIYFFHKDVPEEIVYKFVKQAYESKEMLINTFAGLVVMRPENVKNIRMPLHPGAYRYYKEIGAEVPQNIVPQ